ncbi:damage-control phosphatase At2g17340-like [Malus sylvestris]|uniref:damage-control phosphatase At2g17340-like n=1 Tax=Malus sylvestris TaxID=3752 RepID=UPI0021AC24F9|nr:damage-control phosphatase At2g17340-like [Malus sylvestris]
MPIEFNYRACTIPYKFPSNNPRKPTPTKLSWIDLFYNSTPSFKKRAESDASIPDAPARAEKFAQRYTEILEDLKKDPESHGSPPDCILLCRLRDQVLRELGFQYIFKKVKGSKILRSLFVVFGMVVLLCKAGSTGCWSLLSSAIPQLGLLPYKLN